MESRFRKPLPKKHVMFRLRVVVMISPGTSMMTLAPTVFGADPKSTLVFINSRTVVMTVPELLW